MTMDRRDFINTTSAVALSGLVLPPRVQQPQADAATRDLCMRALDAAKTAGALPAVVGMAAGLSEEGSGPPDG